MLFSEAKILIGDDSILARKQLKDILTEFGGMHYIEAANGQEVLEEHEREHADIIFLDIVMPIEDGINATKKIMESDPSAVIIIVSSIGTQELLKNAIEAGAKDFIQKPFSPGSIRRVVEAHFEI